MMDLTTHPLMQTRKAAPGFVRFVYTQADADQMVREIWAASQPGAEKQAAGDAIRAKVGDRAFFAALQSFQKPTAQPVQAAPKVVALKTHSTSGWCRGCGGPVSHGARYCGEC